jgi:predicted transcriptional regulator of viral defense system
MRKLGDDRRVLAALAREAKGGVIAVDAAARAMRLPPAKATVRLARLAKRGWLERLRRGLYLIRPIGAAPDQGAIPEDAWVLAQEVFSPCYVGGWSAALGIVTVGAWYLFINSLDYFMFPILNLTVYS